jgi:methylated-DNA-protein-cysteine methyltransferase related protein
VLPKKQSLSNWLPEVNFKTRVILITKAIPKGRVTSYGVIANLAGLPRGARLVGGVLHFNSEGSQLPWHRVINKQGFISTRCENHTKDMQRSLLRAEGIAVSEDFMVDLSKYGWWG